MLLVEVALGLVLVEPVLVGLALEGWYWRGRAGDGASVGAGAGGTGGAGDGDGAGTGSISTSCLMSSSGTHKVYRDCVIKIFFQLGTNGYVHFKNSLHSWIAGSSFLLDAVFFSLH